MSQSVDAALLGPMATGQRLLLPTTVLAVLFFTVASPALHVVLPAKVYVYNGVVIACLAVLAALILRRRIPERWGHVVGTINWWGMASTIFVTQYCTHNPVYLLLLMIGVVSAGMMLHPGHLIGTLIGAHLIAIPLILRDGEQATAMSIAALVTSAASALTVHVLVRKALDHVEAHRAAEADTARQLARQLAELETSHAERDRLENQLLHAQRMEAVGTLAAGIAHDMNNVLGAICSFAGLVRDELSESTRRGELPGPAVRGELEQIITEAERGAGLTRGLLAFSRRGQYRKQVIRVDAVLRDGLALLERTLPKSIAIRDQLAVADTRIEGDPVHLVQAIVNFGLNAADAMSGTGTLVLAAQLHDAAEDHPLGLSPGRYVRISVIDSGIGMDAATRLRVFEPFFTTKPLGRGTGLGLSSVWGIAHVHGGAVDVESEPGRGATFSLYLPTTEAPLTEHAPPAPSQPIARGGKMLVVDDEPAVRRGTARILEKLGFEVTCAGDGAEALRIFAERGDAFDLVVLDMGMPVMGGPECFAELRKASRVPVLIATGYAVDAEAQALVAAGAGIIEKPFRAEDLVREVSRMLPRQ